MEIEGTFNIPLYYNSKKRVLDEHILTELELLTCYDACSNSMSECLYGPKSTFKEGVQEQLLKLYTTDTVFLKQQQKIMKNMHSGEYECVCEDDILPLWSELGNESGFNERYCYVDWAPLNFLNKNRMFLQIMSVLNLMSPVLSFCVPFIILLIPFFIINLKGMEVSTSQYLDILKVIASQHAIGKLFTDFSSVNINQKIYLLGSAAFYMFSIYQNVMLCNKFYTNMKQIHQYFFGLKKYIRSTLSRINSYSVLTDGLTSHSVFNAVTLEHKNILEELISKIDKISELDFSMNKLLEIGQVLEYFYSLYISTAYKSALSWSFGFNGYIECLICLNNNIREKKVRFCKFTANRKKSKIVGGYHASLKEKNPIKNDLSLKCHLLITGPNASGKTTTLKATFLNLLFSQQFGGGFYLNANIAPFTYFHCYLNIPDTSGRDSLFQAEARRCKEVIDKIIVDKEPHFCIFDELYSGTNPEEAVGSAFGLMKYLAAQDNVTCLITTHYISLCSKLSGTKNIKNYHMKSVLGLKNNLQYTYKLKPGISTTKGGLHVLTKLHYPEEILNMATKA